MGLVLCALRIDCLRLIGLIQRMDVFANKLIRDSPVPSHRNCELALSITFQCVELVAGQVHVKWENQIYSIVKDMIQSTWSLK